MKIIKSPHSLIFHHRFAIISLLGMKTRERIIHFGDGLGFRYRVCLPHGLNRLSTFISLCHETLRIFRKLSLVAPSSSKLEQKGALWHLRLGLGLEAILFSCNRNIIKMS